MSGQLRAIAPELDAEVVSIAENQTEYRPIYAALTHQPGFFAPDGWNTIVLAFRPDEAQRAAIAAGEDIYVSLLTGGGPMQPIMVLVGKRTAGAAFNVPVIDADGH